MNYSRNQGMMLLARSLSGQTIAQARVIENIPEGIAYVELSLADGRRIKIGAHGSLHDEAYFVFKEKS